MRALLRPLYRLLEHPAGYALNQRIGRPTTDRYRALIARHVGSGAERTVLDIGCGIGSFRDCFHGRYCGIDINPAYIAAARAGLPGQFVTMDATRLAFRDASFDDVVTVATMHHPADGDVVALIREATRVCRPGGCVHIIDAIQPVSPVRAFKRLWFGLDRGAFPRSLHQLQHLAGLAGRVVERAIETGPLHDVAYIAVAPRPRTQWPDAAASDKSTAATLHGEVGPGSFGRS
jgi:ubiquinone/menaquinone biosynthesis C-methylase UbiE